MSSGWDQLYYFYSEVHATVYINFKYLSKNLLPMISKYSKLNSPAVFNFHKLMQKTNNLSSLGTENVIHTKLALYKQ